MINNTKVVRQNIKSHYILGLLFESFSCKVSTRVGIIFVENKYLWLVFSPNGNKKVRKKRLFNGNI